jgi:beta-lactamase regulating signal transducer with metallopeptidase domain
LEFYPGDKFVLLAGNVLLQVTIVILAAWLLARIVFRRNAAIRHNIWLSALTLTIFSPFTAYIADVAGLRIVTISVPNGSRVEFVTASSGRSLTIPSEIVEEREPGLHQQSFPDSNLKRAKLGNSISADMLPQARPVQPLTVIDRLRAIAVLVIAVWGFGMFYLLVRLFQCGYALRILLQTAQMADEHSNLRPAFAEIRRLLGTNRLPCVLLWRDSKISITPLTAGIFRPVVILSRNLLESLDYDELCNVLVHECAHVLRHDPLVGLLQRVVEIIFWPYPLVLFMNRNLARAREEVCDNYVLMHTDGQQYAQTLFDLSQQIHPHSPSLVQVGLFQYSWSLEQRVAGLLDTRRIVVTKINRFTMGVMTVLFLTAVIIVSGTRLLQAEPPATADKVQPGISANATPQIQRRTVNKSVKDFPETVDLSTPESAFAAYHRANIKKDAKAVFELSYWRGSGPRELQAMEQFFISTEIGASSQALLDAEIIEVAVYHDDFAEVISKLKFPEGVGRDPYSARSFGRINGVWKNLGEYRLPSLEAARENFELKKDVLWRNFLEVKDIVSGKMNPPSGQTLDLEYPELRKRSAEEVEVFKALVEQTDHTFKSAELLYYNGAKGGEAVKYEFAGLNTELAKADLAWAERRIEDAYAHTYRAACFAKGYLEAATAAYEMGTITLDSLGDSQVRWAKTRLQLIRAEKVANAAGVDLTAVKRREKEESDSNPKPQ